MHLRSLQRRGEPYLIVRSLTSFDHCPLFFNAALGDCLSQVLNFAPALWVLTELISNERLLYILPPQKRF